MFLAFLVHWWCLSFITQTKYYFLYSHSSQCIIEVLFFQCNIGVLFSCLLAGLWGGHNTHLSLMASIRDDMFAQPENYSRNCDQYLLATKVWPIIKVTTSTLKIISIYNYASVFFCQWNCASVGVQSTALIPPSPCSTALGRLHTDLARQQAATCCTA